MAGNHHSERKGIGLQETDELIPVPLYKENTFNLVKSTSWEPRGRGWQWHLWSLSRHEGSGEKCIKIWRVQMMAHILQSMKYPVTGPWLLNSPPKSPHWPRNVLKNTVQCNFYEERRNKRETNNRYYLPFTMYMQVFISNYLRYLWRKMSDSDRAQVWAAVTY